MYFSYCKKSYVTSVTHKQAMNQEIFAFLVIVSKLSCAKINTSIFENLCQVFWEISLHKWVFMQVFSIIFISNK